MTPKEKARELVDKMHLINSKKIAKKCAFIAVEEIIDAIDWHEYEFPNKEVEYWQQVKKEIEAL